MPCITVIYTISLSFTGSYVQSNCDLTGWNVLAITFYLSVTVWIAKANVTIHGAVYSHRSTALLAVEREKPTGTTPSAATVNSKVSSVGYVKCRVVVILYEPTVLLKIAMKINAMADTEAM